MAEAVKVESGLNTESETFFKVVLGKLSLTEEGFRLRKVAVGLDVEASCNVPAAVFNMLCHPAEYFRSTFFDGLIEPRLSAGDEDFRVTVKQVASGACGRYYFIYSLRSSP